MLVPRRLIQGKQFPRRWESPASLLLPGMQHGPWLHHAAHRPALLSQQPRPNPGSNAPAPDASDVWHAVRRGKSKQQGCSGPSLAAAAALPHASAQPAPSHQQKGKEPQSLRPFPATLHAHKASHKAWLNLLRAAGCPVLAAAQFQLPCNCS